LVCSCFHLLLRYEVLFIIPADPKNEVEMAAYKMRMGAVVKPDGRGGKLL
jgi:hypothetical protein